MTRRPAMLAPGVLAAVGIWVALLLALGARESAAACPVGQAAAEVVDRLKRGEGGYIILLRHAEKERGSDCRRIRLTGPGNAQAKLIGESFRSFGPAFAGSVSRLYHSPCRRTRETASGILEATEWTHLSAESEAALKRNSGVTALRSVMDRAYENDKNALIVAHSDEITPLHEADALTCGEAAVMSRRQDGAFECHARLMPYEWNPQLNGKIHWPDCENHNATRQGRLRD